MLKWARESAGLSAQDVASAERIYLDQLLQWERGDSTPTISMLRRLGKRYKRPLMVFYLPEPPQGFSVVKDFRHLSDAKSTLSPQLRYAIRRAQERQAWASEYLIENGVPANELVGSLAPDSDLSEASRQIRTRLGITVSDQAACKSALEAFRIWRDGIESLGVFVFQATHVDVTEMRGCALPDQYAPVILINSKDADVAKNFTLFHELGHLLLGESALTGSESVFPHAIHSNAERFCNRFAAEVLVPRDDIRQEFPEDWELNEDELLRSAARRYAVSRAVVAYRLVEVGLASRDWLAAKWNSLQSAPKDGGGPQPQHLLTLSRNGNAFSRLATSAYHGGYIHGGTLYSLLGMKLKHLPQLESVLYPAQIQAGLRA